MVSAKFSKVVTVVALLSLSIAALIAIVRIFGEIVCGCSGAFAEDYFAFVKTVDFLLSNGLHHVEKYYYGTHFIPVPFLVCVLNALLFNWNMHVELFLSFLLYVTRVVVVWLILKPSLSKPIQFQLLAAMIALQFLPMEISLFDYALAGIPAGFGTLGFCLALFFLLKGESKPAYLNLSGVFALISSYSIGTTIPCWAALCAAAALRRMSFNVMFKAWLLPAVLSFLPYLGFLLLKFDNASLLSSPGFSWKRLIDLLALPLRNANGPDDSIILVSVITVLITAFLALSKSHKVLAKEAESTVGALSLVFYAALCAILICVARANVSPWYSAYSFLFWCGGSALVLHAIISCERPRLQAILFAALLGTVEVSIWNSAFRDFQKFDYFAYCRGTAAAHILRNWERAPTEVLCLLSGTNSVYLSEVYSAAGILRKRNWGSFWRTKTISLQEEYGFAGVSVFTGDAKANIVWLKSPKSSRLECWANPKRLYLKLPARASLSWTPDLKNSSIAGAFTLQAQAARAGMSARLHGSLYDQSKNRILAEKIVDLHNGQSVLKLSFDTKCSAPRLVLQAEGEPVLIKDCRLDLSKPIDFNRLEVRSSNISPSNVLDATQYGSLFKDGGDISLPVSDFRCENLSVKGQSKNGTEFETEKDSCISRLIYSPAIKIDPSKFKSIIVPIKVSGALDDAAFCLQYVVNGGSVQSRLVPFWRTGDMQYYELDLKLSAFNPEDRITGLMILPFYLDRRPQGSRFELGRISFLAPRSLE